MDPNNKATDDMQLPAIQPAANPMPQQAPGATMPAPSAEPPMTVPPQQGAAVAPAVAPTAAPATNVTGANDQTPAIADDADLIEKEWVEKAKQLVEQTKNDPHKQNEVINKFKADYIKKRYNKDIKLK